MKSLNIWLVAAGVAMTIIGFMAKPALAAEYFTDVGIGMRTDNVKWSIGYGALEPNILSELTWEDVRSLYFSADHRIIFLPNVSQNNDRSLYRQSGPFFRMWGGIGTVMTGENQDSDYSSNDRQDEFSRSNNRVDGDTVLDVSWASGWYYRKKEDRGVTWSVSSLIGYGLHQQKFNMVSGNQTIDTQSNTSGSIIGLNSTYKSLWRGPMVGLLYDYTMSTIKDEPRMRIIASAYYHIVDFHGEGVWNLREDLAKDPSFKHNATGYGWEVDGGFEYNFSRNFLIGVDVSYGRWLADEDGVNMTFYSDDSVSAIKFNQIEWTNWTVATKFTWTF